MSLLLTSSSSSVFHFFLPKPHLSLALPGSFLSLKFHQQQFKRCNNFNYDFRLPYRYPRDVLFQDDEDEDRAEDCKFDEAVFLFNHRDYYRCHDFLESLWNEAEEPIRTLLHGILQCAVGFHHLFNQNHHGAMIELGEGLSKLRKMNFHNGPFYEFEQEISATLDFIYQTQLELAACADDLCLTMNGSERSYQLLGSFAAGQHLYRLEIDSHNVSYIAFCPDGSGRPDKPLRVKVPTLQATEEHLKAYRICSKIRSTNAIAKK